MTVSGNLVERFAVTDSVKSGPGTAPGKTTSGLRLQRHILFKFSKGVCYSLRQQEFLWGFMNLGKKR